MFDVTGMKPADPAVERCINVTYTGSLDADMLLGGTSNGGALASHLTVTITRGTLSGSPPSCASFSPDSSDYIGEGQGVVYKGPVSGLPTTEGTALVDPVGSNKETWSTDETHAYRFAVDLQDTAAAQGLSAPQVDFAWMARSL